MMSKTTHAGRCFTLGLICLLIAGCGGGSGADLGTVTGKVTLDGKALEGATIQFQPAGKAGRPSSAVTDANGEYELKYTMKEAGALVGDHVVRIKGPGIVVEGADEEKEGATYPEQKATVESGSNELNIDVKAAEAELPEEE